MKTQRNRWRVICLREDVPGMWGVGELKPANAFAPETWWSSAIFHSYEAAIVYATRRAAGYPHNCAMFKASQVDARVAMEAALSALSEAQRLADRVGRRDGDDRGAY